MGVKRTTALGGPLSEYLWSLKDGLGLETASYGHEGAPRPNEAWVADVFAPEGDGWLDVENVRSRLRDALVAAAADPAFRATLQRRRGSTSQRTAEDVLLIGQVIWNLSTSPSGPSLALPAPRDGMRLPAYAARGPDIGTMARDRRFRYGDSRDARLRGRGCHPEVGGGDSLKENGKKLANRMAEFLTEHYPPTHPVSEPAVGPPAAIVPVLREPDPTSSGAGLLGRERELAQLTVWLAGEARLIALVGIGGQGKSSLLRGATNGIGGGIGWVDVADAPSVSELVTRIQRVLHLPADGDPLTLHAAISQRTDIVCLDNVEALLVGQDLPPAVLRLLTSVAQNSRLRLLITSRMLPNRLLEETAEVSRSMLLEGLGVEATRRLFEGTCGRSISDASARLIAHWSDGNPLAVKLLAGRVRDEADVHPDRLQESVADASRDIASLVESHLSELTARELSMVRALAWHGGHLSIATVERLTGETTDIRAVLTSLRRRSLLDLDVDRGHVALHALVVEAVQRATREALVDELLADAGDPISELEELLLIDPRGSASTQTAQGTRLSGVVEDVRSRGLRGEPRWRDRLAQLAMSGRRPGRQPLHLAANVLALARVGGVALDAMDLSGLLFQSADFRGLSLAGADVSESEFESCEFSDDFGPVTAVAVVGSSSGVRWLAGTFEGFVREWDEAGTLRASTAVGESWISQIVGDGDLGYFAATVGGLVVHVDANRAVNVLAQLASQVRGIAVGPDQTVWAVCSNGSLYRIDATTGAHEECWRSGYRLKFVSVRPSDGALAIGGDDARVVVGDLTAGFEALLNSTADPGWTRCGVFDVDGSLVVGDDAGRVTRWTESGGHWSAVAATDHGSRVWSLAVGAVLASGGNDGVVRLWDPATLEPRGTLAAHSSWVRSLAFGPSGTTLLSGGEDQRFIAWDLPRSDIKTVKAGYSRRVFSVDVIEGGETRIVASIGDHRLVAVGEDATERPVSWRGHRDQVFVCRASRGLVASGSDDGEVRLWTPDGHEILVLPRLHSGWVGALDFTPTALVLASGGDDKRIVLSDTVLGTTIRETQAHDGRVSGLQFHEDALFSCSEDGTVRSFDALTLQPRERWTLDDGPLYALGVTADVVVVAGHSGRVWRISHASPERTMIHDFGVPVWSLAVDRTGARLVVGLDDGGVVVVEGSVLPRRIAEHAGQVWSVRWHPDGRRVVSGGQDARILVTTDGSAVPPRQIPVPSLYDGMVLRGASGFTPAARSVMTRLGVQWS